MWKALGRLWKRQSFWTEYYLLCFNVRAPLASGSQQLFCPLKDKNTVSQNCKSGTLKKKKSLNTLLTPPQSLIRIKFFLFMMEKKSSLRDMKFHINTTKVLHLENILILIAFLILIFFKCWKLELLIFGCCHFKVTWLNLFITSAVIENVQAT